MKAQNEQIYVERNPQEIYSSADNNQKLSYFYNSNRIISSTQVVFQFFKHFQLYSVEKQENFLNELLSALRSVSTNSYLLNEQIKGKNKSHLDRICLLQGHEDQKSIITVVVSLIVSNVKNYLIEQLLQQVLDELLPYSSLQQSLLQESISNLTVNYYNKKVNASQLFAISSVVKSLYHSKIIADKDAENMLVFHGLNKLQILPSNNQPLTWTLKEGFTLLFWINIQNIKSGVQTSLAKLFTFYAPEIGGIQSYLIDNKVYYRILGAKYTEPQIGSNGILLGQLQPKKWNFVCFEHEGHHTFQKSKLKFFINKTKPNVVGLDPPKVSSTSQTKYIFFDKIYCKTSSICLFPFLLGQEGIEEYNKNISSIENVKNPKAFVFEARQGKVFERTGFGVSHNFIFQRNLDMNFQLVLPLFFLIGYQEKDQLYPTLNELLSCLVLFLRKSSQNQSQAVKNGYFKQISQLICDIQRNIFDQNTINSILHIKHTITDPSLLDQYFSEFLWPLLNANIPLIRKQQILEIIKNAFTQNIAHFSTQIGLDEMINALQKLEGSMLTCCQKHYKIASNKFQRPLECQYSFGQEKKAQGYIFALIENSFQNSKIQYAHEIYKLCRLLCLKFSPCFILQLMSLLKKLLNQKFNQRMSESQTKQIIKYFQQKKVHLIFLHVIENNFFAEIKAQSVKLIYSFLTKKSSIEESSISYLISKSLWKINQFAEQKAQSNKKKQKSEGQQIQPKQNEYRPLLGQIQQQQPNKEFALVGPQAPALSNRLKGKKSFDFGFVNEKMPRHREVMEEEKTAEPDINVDFVVSNPLSRKDKKKILSINTQAINEMYTFGGQKGQQIIISQDEESNEIEKIVRLAKKCVAAMKGESNDEGAQQITQTKKSTYIPPPMTTKNKVAMAKKNFNLNLISEEQQQIPIKIPTPLATKKSNKTPTSIKSSNEQNLFTLYNSLLESCLGVSFQTSLIANSKIQVPSILSIFFKWIPQTDLQTKFLNDLDIILQSNENMALVVELPQLYDFLFELSYKCLFYEELKQKRVYTEKLQNIIKLVFSYIFKEDAAGFSKFSFILDWTQSKKDQCYEPKCLFLTSRYAVLLILQSIEELLIMNNTNDQVMERNFQSLSIIIDTLKKIIPEDIQQLATDQCERVIFASDFDLPPSLIPYFKSNWADYILHQKYLFLFNRFYCTDWYKNGLKHFSSKQYDLLDYLKKTNISLLQKQSIYYMKNHFLISLIQIHRAMLIQFQNLQLKQMVQYGQEAVWQTILLVIFVEFNKQKSIKSQRSEIILTFLKSCKLLAEKGIERIVDIVPMLSITKLFISLSNNLAQNNQKPIVTTQILDDIIGNYIPEYLLNMGKTDLQSFILNFSQVWIPNENHYKKIHSDLFINYKQKIKKDIDVDFIQFISAIIQEENQRRQLTDVILEAYNRANKNSFRKTWYSLRVYGTIWTHPHFKWQEDKLFTKTTYAFQRYEANPYFKYKISKQFSKGKGRYFLKPRLIEPEFPKENAQSQSQYNLEKALKIMNEKLIIGVSKKSWILPKSQQILYFMMDFKNVKIINTLTLRSGYLAIISDSLVFISCFQTEKPSHLSIDQFRLRNNKTLHKCWPLEYIRQIFKRRYVNRKKSIQINFIHNKSVIFDFETEQQSQQFCKKILKLQKKCINLSFVNKSLDPKKLVQAQDYLKKWMNYQMNTFDYLMELNTLAGRSYSDLTQYPIFPWTLKNFTADKCILNSENSMRDLTKTMGANGTQQRVHNFQQRYEVMQMQEENASKFHYGTHYSSPGVIYHFLIRLSPYTQGAISLQSGKFDFADRLFFSLADSYKNAISQYSDVRELLPELYTIPQAYLNINGLDFGVMQNKKRVHNVELPNWCLQNPYYYVYYMKKCIQQEVSSRDINNWIDLIFGYKQRGQEAVKALNCFYYLTYEDSVNWASIKNIKDVQSIQSQILNFGQTPSQLYVKPHPQRNVLSSLRNFRMITDHDAEPKVYRPSRNTKQSNGQQQQLNPLKQIDQSIIFMKWISQSKLVFIRKSGEIIFYKCYPNTNPASKVPFQCTIQKQKKIDRIRKQIFDPTQFYDPSLQIQNFPMDLIGVGHTICLGGLSDGKIVLIDIDTGSLVQSYTNHASTISCLKADPRQNFLITGDIKGNVIFWEIKTNSSNISKIIEKKVIKDQSQQITSIYFSNELQCVAIASTDGSVFVYNSITAKKIRVYYHHKRAPINQVIITSNPLAAIIMFCNQENTIYSYSLNGQLIARAHEKTFQCFLSPIIIKDSKSFEYVAYGNQKSQINIRVLPFLEHPHKHNFKVARDACVNKISISKYSRFLVSGCSDGELTVITDPNILAN